MSEPQVLCLGEVLFDCIADRPGRSLEAVETWTAYPGGAPANVACALVKLGVPAGLIGCLGQDEAGEALLQHLQSVGVDCSGVQRHASAPTRRVYVLRTEAGDREFAGFGSGEATAEALRAPEAFADAHLQASQLPAARLARANFLVLGTLELAYADSGAAVRRALALAQQHGVKVLLDINWRPIFWPQPERAQATIAPILEAADWLKCSAEEAQWLFGTVDPDAIARQLERPEGVFVTDGGGATRYNLNGHSGTVAAFEVPVEDTTGAGDGFVAGLLSQFCQRSAADRRDPAFAREAVVYASAVGGLTATRAGAMAAQPSAAEVAALLQRSPAP